MVAAVSLPGCASPARTLTLRAGGMQSIPLGGVPHLLSHGQTGSVALALLTPTYSPASDGLPGFSIGYLNSGDFSVDFGIANMAVTCGGKPVRVYTRSEMAAKLDRAAAQRMGAAMATGRRQMGASMQANSPHPSSAGGATENYTLGSFPAPTRANDEPSNFDPVAATQAQGAASATINALMAANLNSTQAQARLRRAEFGDLLRLESVAPGTMVLGRIVLHAEDITVGTPLEITVTVGDDIHRFVCENGGG